MCCKSVNWDDTLSYDTAKVVRVRDAKLGLLRLFFLAIIIAYISIKVIWIDAAYNVHDTPNGAARISLEFPKSPVKLSEELFCPQHPDHASKWPFAEELDYPCQIWDEHNIRYPADEINSIFLTTRAHIQEQKYECGQENTRDDPLAEDECIDPYSVLDDYKVFLAGVHNFTLGVQHSFFSPQFNAPRWSGNSRALPGKLVDPDGKVIRVFPPADAESDLPDIMSLAELLQSSGSDLYLESKDPNNSQYYSGIVLMVLIRYENHGKDISYTYHAKQINNADYKLFETRWAQGTETKTTRMSIKRAGVKTIFLITGDFKQFDFQTLLIQFVSAMGLLSVCTLVVEFIMLYIMKFRKHYRRAKYDETDDFSALYLSSSSDGTSDGDIVMDQSSEHTDEQSVNIDNFNTRLLSSSQ